MKKINYKKLFNLTFRVLIVSGLVTALGFVNAKEKNIIGKEVNVNVIDADEEGFVDREDIMEFLRERNDTIKGEKMSAIDINNIEKALLTHPAVEDAQVSVSIDGTMNIEINQRKPLLRIFTADGESYYIDHNAKLMPLSENYTARVLTAGGNILEPYTRMFQYNMIELAQNKFLSEVSVLDDLYLLADFIEKDTLLSDLIQQVNVNDKKEFELYPAIGDHKIIFGKLDNMGQKFEKLKIFYTEGLNSVDWWNRYSAINLKFEGQVVCTKKIAR